MEMTIKEYFEIGINKCKSNRLVESIESNVEELKSILSSKGVPNSVINTAINMNVDEGILKGVNKLVSKYMSLDEMNVSYGMYSDKDTKLLGVLMYSEKEIKVNYRFDLCKRIIKDQSAKYLFKFIGTIIHEYRHVWQHVNNPEILKKNRVLYMTDYDYYKQHSSEVDAENYRKENVTNIAFYIQNNINVILNCINDELINHIECEEFAAQKTLMC